MRDRKDRMEVWKTFQGPKLMIAGEFDVAVKLEASRLHKPFSTQYYELKGVGHMGMFEAEKESLELVKSFLDSID
jgi:pimeloyl-ACP methyl ester carboxylesterase